MRQTQDHDASAAPVNASHIAAEAVGQIAAEAAAMATVVGNAASAAAARAKHTPPEPRHSTDRVPEATRPNRLDLETLRGVLAHGLDEGVRTEFAVFLADPVMPRFSADLGPETVVSFASPAEQGLWRDISLARRMEAALRGREAHFEAAFHSAPTAMLIASLVDGRPARFLHVNVALSLLTGYSPSNLLDLGFADLAHPDQPALQEEPAISGRREAEQPVLRVRRWVHADGSDLWVRIRTATLRYSGYGTKQVCHIEDVTAQIGADTAPAGITEVVRPRRGQQDDRVRAQARHDSSLTQRGTADRQEGLLTPGPRQPWDH